MHSKIVIPITVMMIIMIMIMIKVMTTNVIYNIASKFV